jgi:outer membrane protein OmpA-like peptidoglycan-associated protein
MEPLADEPMADEPIVAEPLADEPMADEPMADEPMAGEPMADEPMAAEPMADEPMAAEPPAEGALPAEEFDIQPEAFAFESDFGEFESGLGEVEPEWGFEAEPRRWESWQRETPRRTTGAPASCPPRRTSVKCPPRGARPSAILDYFGFDSANVNSGCHTLLLDDAARRVIQTQTSRQPIRSILLVGHADASGRERYNVGLGQRRAEAVLLRLCRTLERMRPGITRSITFQVASCGETQTKATPELSRRVEIFLPTPPAPAGCPPFTERIRLHMKILARPSVSIPTMLASMRQVYEPAGFLVEFVSCEVLRLPTLEVLDVRCPGDVTQTCCPFPCPTANLNAEHVALFQQRNNVESNELAIYFVCQTIPDLRGCCAHPPGRPGAVVASSATQWTLGHEVGHVLGLQHVCNTNRLMNDGNCGGTAAITNPPPDLTAAEIQTMTASNLSTPC